MGKKLDIRKNIATRKYGVPCSLPYLIYYIVGRTNLLGAKYKPHFIRRDKLPRKGPCFLIWNHQSRRDHTFLCTAVWPRKMSIVCEANEFFRSHLHFAFWGNNILPKKPFDTTDYIGLKAIDSSIKKGGVIALSPEGNVSNFGNNQPIALGTGKLMKRYNIPVYMVRLNGSFLTNNKYYDEDRIGRVDVELYKLFTSEDIQRMSAEEIEERINTELRFDDFEWNKTARVKFSHKTGLCTNLSDMCYRCPSCGKEFVMESKDDYIKCTSCGNGTTMDDYYDFHPYEGSVIPDTPTKWVYWERENIIKEIKKDPNYEFSFECDIGMLPNDHYIKNHGISEKVGSGKVIINHSGLHFIGTKNGGPYSFDIDYKNLYTFSIPVDLSRIALYVKGEYIDFAPYIRGCGAKAILVVEEMHRLHVNAWKNFPWFDYMYKEDNYGK